MQKIQKWQPKVLSDKVKRSKGNVESFSYQTGQEALFKAVAKNDEYSVS